MSTNQNNQMLGAVMNEPGYEKLSDVLRRAYDQAAIGKGKERHANGEPFHEQVMQTGAHRFGTGALLFQAFKKSEESQRLPHDRAIAELLGAIVYLAGAVIALERAESGDIKVGTSSLGWGPIIEWSGGFSSPVDFDQMIIIKTLSGDCINAGWRNSPRRAGDVGWGYQSTCGQEGDIVAYRTVD